MAVRDWFLAQFTSNKWIHSMTHGLQFLMIFSIYCRAVEFKKEIFGESATRETLACLCNDNNQCVMNALPLNLSNMFTHAGPMGFCVTVSEGRCYTAKDISIGSTGNTLRMRRFIKNSEKNKSPAVSSDDLLSDSTGDSKENQINVNKFIRVRYGCLSSDQKITFACNGHLVKHLVPKTIACCNSSDFCNANLTPEFFHHSSNEEAIRTALKNQKLFRGAEIQIKKYLDPGLNLGPQLLSGGITVNRSTKVVRDSEEKLQPAGTKLFYFILVISFGIVAVILFSTLTAVCIVYNCRRQSKALHAIIVQKKTRKSNIVYVDETHAGKRAKENNTLNNYCDPTRANHQTLGSGTTYQTASTNSTQNAESFTEVQPSNQCQTMRLNQETISSQVNLRKLIGSGRFSDVWLASWQGESVLAKIFIPDNRLAQSLWRRTVSLHRSTLLRHHTIQGLMAVDWIEYPGSNHLCSNSHLPRALMNITSPRAMLIGELHPWGSLQDLMATHRWYSRKTCPKEACAKEGAPLRDAVTRVFTLQRTLSDRVLPPALTTTDELMLKVLLRMALSITQGVCFLHSEFAGTRGKPALAHRNLKPSNVFVRSDWTCCIGDIGFAVRPPPCPLPVPLTELHAIYKQYMDQLERSTRPDEIPVGRGDSPPKETTGLLQPPELIPTTHTNVNSLARNEEGNQSISKLTVAKAELLDWWPVGGHCAGTLRYLAPELLTQAVDPFCFEAHQRADIYSLGLILWELLAWALPQTFRLRHEQCEQCRGSDSSRSSAQSNSLSHPEALLDRQACPRHYLTHVAYEVELRTYALSLGAQGWSTCSNQSIGRPTYRQVQSCNSATAVLNDEPDFQTMYHLVCEAQVRPQLPQVTSGPWISLLTQYRSSPNWMYSEPSAATYENYTELVDPRTAAPHCHSTIPQFRTVHPIKHIDSTSHSSTSSGASSLQGTQSGAHSSSTDHTRPSISSGELTHMICLVAQQWASLLPECWSPNPDARLTAQRVRKVLQKLTDRLDLFRMSRNETPSVLRHHAMRSITTQPRSSSPTIQEARSK
uniref:receptor protein serine/threonine kinase n=1 Tax=Fasciola gigantica TaxID=46835 RepID=A0AA51NIS0_FASGI|nr:bone morphogenetic protein receptor type-1 [Fasciola gigantica]